MQTTARYAHLAADPVKAAAEQVSAVIAQAVGGEERKQGGGQRLTAQPGLSHERTDEADDVLPPLVDAVVPLAQDVGVEIDQPLQ